MQSRYQSGQAIVLILLLSIIGVLGAVMLVSTGVLTSEKMQLQNAADATAYSVSVLEARDLNYGAYMNRAMVGNEVAIGQMVSMYSWVKMLESEPAYLNAIASGLNAIPPPVGTALSAIVKGFASYIRTTSRAAGRVVYPLSEKVVIGLKGLNQAYSFSQQAMHLATLVFSASAVSQVPKYNVAENQSDVSLSAYGWFALAMHYGSYYGDLLSLPVYQFVKHPSGSDPEMSRFAQVVNDSRDGFTRHRSCSNKPGENLIKDGLDTINDAIQSVTPPTSIDLGPVTIGIPSPVITGPSLECNVDPQGDTNGDPTGGWALSLMNVKMDMDYILDLGPLGEYGYAFGVELDISANRFGGTQLLYADAKEEYIWSAADGAGLGVTPSGYFEICIIDCLDETITISLPEVPYGAASAFAGIQKPNMANISANLSPHRDVLYGGLSGMLAPWAIIQTGLNAKNLSQPYRLAQGGYQMISELPQIASFENSLPFIGMEAPYILIGLTRDKNEIFNAGNLSGNLKLEEADTKLAAVAKAQVYYSSPDDLSVFSTQRAAAANGFNPYWDARLVDTSYLDRVSALVFQSGQIPLPGEINGTINSFNKLLATFGSLFK
ncbi:MAG: pilus assembly protein TadG-related protein [Pseudomonadales bacterium]|nr:pilus assembly protein TadG-related protein [Pseudomonadales bacterium]NRA15008.1 hypothetical protein [Oceanospirillaceae bacterium]